MIEELISKVFNTRNHAHLEHWATESGYHHVVLGEFYDSIIEDLDAFVEAYQGNNTQLDVFQPEPYKFESSVLKCIEKDIVWFEENRDAICDGVRPLENLYDGLVDTYLSTRYKLKNQK